MPLKFGLKSGFFSRSCIDLSSTRRHDGDSEIIVAMGLGFRGSQLALGQVTTNNRSRRHSHSSRTTNAVSANNSNSSSSGGILSRNNSRGKADGRLSRNNSKGKSDGRLSRNNSRGKSDGRLSRSNSKGKSDGRLSRNNSRGKADGRLSRSNSRGKSDGKVSRNNSRGKADGRVSRSSSRGKSDGRESRSNSVSKSEVRLTRSNSHSRADDVARRNSQGNSEGSSNGLIRSRSHGNGDALSVLSRSYSRRKPDEVHWKTKCKLELKPLEPVYQDVRVVIPQLESSMSVEYDQFSTVGDVLHQVLSLSDTPLDPTEGYSLYHVRLRLHMDQSDSMVYYQILPADVLECRLSVGRLHSVIITIKIPSIQSCRKVKVSLDETVGELMSTLMRRVPDPESPRWNHMALYLHSREPNQPGIWMEDYKFLAAYKLKPTDIVDFRPKYRPMQFELRVFPHDHDGYSDQLYAIQELLVAQDTLVYEVIDLLCNSSSLEYDPRFYGLFLHDDTMLPADVSMWEHLDESAPTGYQDSLVMHMIHKPVQVSFNSEEDSSATILVDFSQPCRVVRNILCRRYGVRHHYEYGLQYEGTGIALKLSVSLHNQGILEQEMITLIHLAPDNPDVQLAQKTTLKRTSSIKNQKDSDPRRASMVPDDDANVWDEGPDSSENIRFDKKNPALVTGATFNKLVQKMTSERDHDLEFVKTFLYTYQSFSTPERLFKKLIERYNVVRPVGVSLKEFSVRKQTIQARVINAFKLWVDLSADFKDNPALQNDVLHFINTDLIHDHPRLCKPLRTNILVIKGVIQKKNLKMFREPPPPVKFPLNPSAMLTIFDFDPEEIARQLTLIDFSLFAKIKPAELLNQAWQKAKYKHRAVNILRLVDRMNNLTLWVATTILSQRDVHERAKRITDFVQISVHLLELHNYCTLMSILNGLAHPSITRLKKSFVKLDKSTSKRLEQLQALARPGENFKLLRDELKKANNPCIPYLGLYMSDLTFLDNGNPNLHADGLINFSKCRLIYNRIRDLVLRQDKPYHFEEAPALHEHLIKFHFLDTDVLYDVSLQREPRDKGK